MSRRAERVERAERAGRTGGEHFLIMQSLVLPLTGAMGGTEGRGGERGGKVLQLTRILFFSQI